MHPEPGSKENAPGGDPSLREKLKGLLLFRLLMAVFFLALTLVVQSRRQGNLLGSSLQPLYIFACILFAFTIVAALSLQKIRHLKRFAYLQLIFDVEAVTILIYLSGGVDSLFSFLYMPVIISAAVLLFRRGSLLIASVCSVSYGILLDLQYFGWVYPLQVVTTSYRVEDSGTYFHGLLMNIAAFYLVAFLSGYLGEELQKSARQVKKHRDEFLQLERLHRNIVQSINSGLLTIDLSGRINYLNNAAREVLGLTSEEIRGRLLQEVLPEFELGVLVHEADSVTPTDHPSRMEISYQRPTGEKLFLAYTVSSLQAEDNGRTTGWVVIFRDLTELKKMEIHVQRMERLAFAGRIAAEIAHEIRNPLAAMSGAVQMLQTETDGGGLQSQLAGIVAREIERINQLVTDFLWLSRATQSSQKVERVAVCDIIREAVSLLKSQAGLSPLHSIVTEFHFEPLLALDPQRFRQILWNLLVNGLEAMPEGGVLTIRLTAALPVQSGSPEVRIDIEDTGQGIPTSIRDKIFDPFFTTKENGTGLGLSIVYQLVESTGGRLQVFHGRQRGAIFSLFYPQSAEASLPDRGEQPKTGAAPAP